MLPLDGRDGGGSSGSGGVSVPPYPPKHKHRDRARMHVSARVFLKADNFVTPAPSEIRDMLCTQTKGIIICILGAGRWNLMSECFNFWNKIKCRACYLPIGRYDWSARCSGTFVHRGWWLGMRGRAVASSLIVVNVLLIRAINGSHRTLIATMVIDSAS